MAFELLSVPSDLGASLRAVIHFSSLETVK